MQKRIISTAIKLFFTIGLFVLLFRPQTFGLAPDTFGGVTPVTLWNELRAANPSGVFLWLGIAVAIKLTGLLAGVVRWRLLLRGQGLTMPFWYMVQSWFVGRFFGIFMPGTIGLDGYRLFDSALYTRDVIKCATVVAVEKLIGLISLTFLVFVTFPLGFRLFHFNVVILSAILAVLGVFVLVSFLLLLNPRVIQILAAVIPTPGRVRKELDKLGAAITAYSGQRPLLLAAVACGIWVHLSTCIMFACTFMSLRAASTSILDILFASPIMIYGTVVGPSVGGEGIREIIFAMLLGPKTGVTTAVLIGHLGWWVGDVVPFLIGAPIFFLRSRPGKREMQDGLAAARQEIAAAQNIIRLQPDAIIQYRRHLLRYLFAGLSGGLIAGALIGLSEAAWLSASLSGLTELAAFWWGPLVYGILFSGVGLAIAGALAFFSLLLDRFLTGPITFALALAGAAASSGAIILFRFMRDVLHGHPLAITHLAGIAAIALGAALIAGVIGAIAANSLARKPLHAIAAVAAAYILLIAAGAGYAATRTPAPQGTAFNPAVKANGPNIILIAADALRADYLKTYNPSAVANTPNLDKFAKENTLFQNAFAQSSWTKPCFATIFAGSYPGCHTATTKTSMLPSGTVTFPQLLQSGGYYTKGFANNPNIAAAFQFNQGFHDYVDLKPRRYFGATYSASKLALYEVLRRGRHMVMSRISKKMHIEDFYQPAQNVTAETLNWLDSPARPKDAPLFLFVHYMDPHDPFMDHTKPGVGYARVRMENPDPEKFLEPMRKAYISEIEYMDHHIGALFEGLRQRGLYDNSLILFTSDHGEEFYDHNGWWHGQTLFDELVRVPLMMKTPGAPRPQTAKNFARHIDIAPTLLQVAGVQPDPKMQGAPLVDNTGNLANTPIDSVYAESDFENNIIQAVRTNDLKVIRTNEDNSRKFPALQVFDMQKDTGEKNNIAEDPRREPVQLTLDAMINMSINCAPAPTQKAAISQELKDQLEGVGYLGDK